MPTNKQSAIDLIKQFRSNRKAIVNLLNIPDLTAAQQHNSNLIRDTLTICDFLINTMYNDLQQISENETLQKQVKQDDTRETLDDVLKTLWIAYGYSKSHIFGTMHELRNNRMI
jgi:hypothetical protein